jgi:hypothetical protein
MQQIATIPVTKREPMITLTLDQTELQALAGLLDAGVKATGLQSVKLAASLLSKLEAAVAEANKTESKETE